MAQIVEFEEHVVQLPGSERRLVFVARTKALDSSDYIQLSESPVFGSHSGQAAGSSVVAMTMVSSVAGFYEPIQFRGGYKFYTAGNADRINVGRYPEANVIVVSMTGKR